MFDNLEKENPTADIDGYDHYNTLVSLKIGTTSQKVALGTESLRGAFCPIKYDGLFDVLETIDLSGLDTSGVTDMSNMFMSCISLKEIKGLETLDTSKVETMNAMFWDCPLLKNLDLTHFNTENVKDMSYMFMACLNLESLDVNSFDTSKVERMDYMFTMCENLKNIEGLNHFDTSKVENMYGMFSDCEKINVFDLSSFDLSGFKTSNADRMAEIFDCDDFIDDPIPTIIITEDEKLIERYNDPDSIKGRIPYFGNVSFDANGGVFADGSTKQFTVVNDETNHFIYANETEVDQAKAAVSAVPGTDILMNNPSTSLSKEGSVFNGWYLDEACTKPFDEATTIDFTTLANGTLHLYAGYSEPLQAVELIAYEGGSGTDASNHGDALPEPQWEEGLESYAISVDGEAWDLEEEGVPFAWEYRNSEGEKVESAAKAGSYALYALPRVDDKEIRLDEHILSIPEEGMAVGEVKVREVSDESAETLSSEIYKGVYEEEGACQIKEAHAHVKAGTQFYKNGNTMYPVNEDAKIVLLWDELIEEVLGSAERMEALHAKGMEAVKGMDETKEVKREFRYLDLVDQNDGNLWVGTEKETVSVYYPYPEGSEEGDRFAVVYYEGLTRDYTMQMSEEALDEEIAKSKAREIEVRKTEGGLEFEVGSKEFGTFEVMWQKEEKPTEPEEKPNTPNEEEKGESNIEEIKKEESEAVHTGDEVSKGMYYVLLGGSMIVFAAMLRKNRRSEQ
ncbi:BspA family leucine-rich repeat surface protein [Massilicoli timonensis]|uniref:BspA family leucine-rich repeat surface protein n=2 Tax=Massilicoli timonensis TaxID=2015901 RepID=UPI000C82FC6E